MYTYKTTVKDCPGKLTHPAVWVATAFITSVITLSIADTSRNGTRLDHSLLVMGCFTIIATLLLWTVAVTEKADKEETPQREKRPSTRQYVA